MPERADFVRRGDKQICAAVGCPKVYGWQLGGLDGRSREGSINMRQIEKLGSGQVCIYTFQAGIQQSIAVKKIVYSYCSM